ncbi:MAG: hypothetical protein WAV78_35565 [Xanthobacteraceae bacterium]
MAAGRHGARRTTIGRRVFRRGAEDVVRRDLSRLVPELRAGPAFVFEGNA